MNDMNDQHPNSVGWVREEIRLERLKTAKRRQRLQRREDLLSHLMIVLLCALIGSGILWLLVQIWQGIL